MKFFVKSQTPKAPSDSGNANGKISEQSSVDARLQLSLQALIGLRSHANGFALNPARAIKNQFVGRHSSIHRGRGLNFEELSHYRQGDDIRTMDWKVTNRTGKPHVRVFTEERERPIMLACDQRQGMLFGSEHKLKSVVAGEVFALLAWRQLALGDAIASLIFSDHQIFESPPHRSQQMLLRDFKTLSKVNRSLQRRQAVNATSAARRVRLSTVLHHLSQLCPREFLIVLISDLPDLDEKGAQLIKSLAFNNDVYVAHIADPVEHALPAGKQFIASNGELQLAINTTDKVFTQKFNTHQQQRLEQLRMSLRSAGVILMELNTIDDSYRQLRRATRDYSPHGANNRQGYPSNNG